MKIAELVTVLSAVFLITFTIGDGAPQWRPQGRFGKRLDQRHYPLPWQPEADSDIDVYPVVEDRSQTQQSDKSFNTLEKLCVESSFPGLYRCYRRKRSTSNSAVNKV